MATDEGQAVKKIQGNLSLLDKAVSQFDTRFTLRALQQISLLRKLNLKPAVLRIVQSTYGSESDTTKHLLEYLNAVPDAATDESAPAADGVAQKSKGGNGEPLPEYEIYLSILIQVMLYDAKQNETGARFSCALVDRIRDYNRRTLDTLASRAYFYFALFHEQLHPQPPSRQSPVIAARGRLLNALRSAVLRKDEETQAAALTLLLRNYISTADITQADLLVAQTQFPPTSSNNQVARYLYYLGRIRAIQLSYTEAHEHLTGATRKSPTSAAAVGFYQAAYKFLVVVELLMGDIPDRAIFRQPRLERSLESYFHLVQAVRMGDLQNFVKLVQTNAATFRRDGTYTLILRLRQNVIRTGLRMLSISYSRISLRNICIRLGVESEESAEYIVAKAIRDGVIEATIDHEKGYMQSKQSGDIYATREPSEAFHERIQACLGLHDESVKAMRFPMNQHRLELKNAQEARERERELAKEIQDGDIDDDDAGADYDGL